MSDSDIDETKEKLKQLLSKRLEESGWRQSMKIQVQNLVNDKGYEKSTIEDIVQELAPKAKSTISEDIKNELMTEAKKSLKESEHM